MPNNKHIQIGLSPNALSLSAVSFQNGAKLHQAGNLQEAETQYREALKLNPHSFESLHFLGILKAQMDECPEAIELFNKAIVINPQNEQVYLNRGLAKYKLGNLQPALDDFLRSTKIAPQYAEAYFNIGNTYQELGEFTQAVVSYDKAVSFSPGYAEAFNNRGNALQELGQFQEALKSYQRAIEITPNYAEAYFNCGTLFQATKDFQGAIKYFDQAIQLEPGSIEAYVNNGNNFDELNNINESLRYYESALKIDPSSLEARYAMALSRIPKIYSSQKELVVAKKAFEVMLTELETWVKQAHIKDGQKVVGTHQPFFLAYQDTNNKLVLSRYGSICVELMKNLQLTIAMPPQHVEHKKIKVGIASGYIHQHSVWDAIIKGWVCHLDKDIFEIHIFHLGEKCDGETEIAKSLASSFTQGKYSVEEWISIIQEKDLDCLIYPEIGMDRLTCQLASLRIARVQVASWGHPETSGLPTLDYYLSAELFEDSTSQNCYSEKLICLPNLGCHYQPYEIESQDPDLISLGIDPKRPILLCPGTPYKYNPENDWVLVEIARQIPKAQFIFFKFPDTPIEFLRARLSKLFSEANLDFNHQLIFIPLLSTAKFHGLMKVADVFLDTLGFSGFNTAIQAVQCGLPIATKKGQFMRGRLASGVLEQMGLSSLVAQTNEDYIKEAVKISTEANYKLEIANQFKLYRHKLYLDLTPINALADFLIATCRLSKTKPLQ
jgi:predicted O-linked N-acetylglucosamine transferase (SPINDLY family)